MGHEHVERLMSGRFWVATALLFPVFLFLTYLYFSYIFPQLFGAVLFVVELFNASVLAKNGYPYYSVVLIFMYLSFALIPIFVTYSVHSVLSSLIVFVLICCLHFLGVFLLLYFQFFFTIFTKGVGPSVDISAFVPKLQALAFFPTSIAVDWPGIIQLMMLGYCVVGGAAFAWGASKEFSNKEYLFWSGVESSFERLTGRPVPSRLYAFSQSGHWLRFFGALGLVWLSAVRSRARNYGLSWNRFTWVAIGIAIAIPIGLTILKALSPIHWALDVSTNMPVLTSVIYIWSWVAIPVSMTIPKEEGPDDFRDAIQNYGDFTKEFSAAVFGFASVAQAFYWFGSSPYTTIVDGKQTTGTWFTDLAPVILALTPLFATVGAIAAAIDARAKERSARSLFRPHLQSELSNIAKKIEDLTSIGYDKSELAALWDRPTSWQISPRAIRGFIADVDQRVRKKWEEAERLCNEALRMAHAERRGAAAELAFARLQLSVLGIDAEKYRTAKLPVAKVSAEKLYRPAFLEKVHYGTGFLLLAGRAAAMGNPLSAAAMAVASVVASAAQHQQRLRKMKELEGLLDARIAVIQGHIRMFALLVRDVIPDQLSELNFYIPNELKKGDLSDETRAKDPTAFEMAAQIVSLQYLRLKDALETPLGAV